MTALCTAVFACLVWWTLNTPRFWPSVVIDDRTSIAFVVLSRLCNPPVLFFNLL